MTVLDALQQRKSVRAFLDKPVKKETIETILNVARHAPSGVNMQPWKVYVVSGEKKKNIENEMVAAFENDTPANMDYHYYPLKWKEPYKSRRKATGLLMYQTLGITIDDKAGQSRQWKANYRAFDAPTVLYFFIDGSLEKGSYIDYGMFLQSIMLAATEQGVANCTQAALAQYPDIVKNALHVNASEVLLCGIALGYEDTSAKINSYRTDRIALNEFVTFYE